MKRKEKTVLLLSHAANAFFRQKRLLYVLRTSISLLFPFSGKVRMEQAGGHLKSAYCNQLLYTMSSVLAIGAVLFNTLRPFKHDPFSTGRIHEAQVMLRNDRLMSRISKHFYTSNAGPSSFTGIRKGFEASTTILIFARGNHTPDGTDVNVGALSGHCRLSREANEISKELFMSQPPKNHSCCVWEPVASRGKRNKTVPRIQLSDGDAQPPQCIILKCERGIFAGPFPKNFCPGYSVHPLFVKDVSHDWIVNCRPPSVFFEEKLKQLYKTYCPSCKELVLTTSTGLLGYSTSRTHVNFENYYECKGQRPKWK